MNSVCLISKGKNILSKIISEQPELLDIRKTRELLIVDIINAATVTSIYNSSPPDIRFAAENFTKQFE